MSWVLLMLWQWQALVTGLVLGLVIGLLAGVYIVA